LTSNELNIQVQLLCQVLHVVTSRYYAGCQRAVTRAAPDWETALVNVFDEHQRRHDTRRLQVELRALGLRMGRHTL
jgi:hypothetical protein